MTQWNRLININLLSNCYSQNTFDKYKPHKNSSQIVSRQVILIKKFKS